MSINNINPRGGTGVIHDGLRRYMIGVFNKMFMALCLTGVVSALCVSSEQILSFMTGGFHLVLVLATLGIVIYLSARINKMASDTANSLFWVYAALVGAMLSPLFAIYTGESIANAFFMTAIFFGSMSLVGYTTKKDLTSLGTFMLVGLICLVITSIVNVFFIKSSGLEIGLSALCVIIFCGLTAYDVQKIKMFYNPSDPAEVSAKKSILGALSLYLDFLNMFLALLRLFGNRR